MNELNCEYVREVYSDVLHGSADAGISAAVRAHLARCADCREEAQLIEWVHAAAIGAPAGLHERVMARVHAVPHAARFGLKYVALAATVAAALIGGPLLLERWRAPDAVAEAELPSAGGLGVISVEAAMVTGTSSLQDLTVEELEQLLGEIES